MPIISDTSRSTPSGLARRSSASITIGSYRSAIDAQCVEIRRARGGDTMLVCCRPEGLTYNMTNLGASYVGNDGLWISTVWVERTERGRMRLILYALVLPGG